MANIIIEHPDGRRVGTTTEGFKRLAKTDFEGFEVVGEEGPSDFVVEVPTPRRSRRRPSAKRAPATPATPIAAEVPRETAEAEA